MGTEIGNKVPEYNVVYLCFMINIVEIMILPPDYFLHWCKQSGATEHKQHRQPSYQGLQGGLDRARQVQGQSRHVR